MTYRRLETLSKTLDRLAAQTRLPDLLLVVDNGGSPRVREAIEEARSRGLLAEYLNAGDNLGPAGGFALGMTRLLADASELDWVFLFDDDDPPFFDDAIENAMAFADEMLAVDPATAAVGISGGRFDLRRGRVARIADTELDGPVLVDHVTGGGLPAYRVSAVRRVGVFRSELFFGFEELEYGLRLTRAGFHIYADGVGWKERRRVKRKLGLLPSEELSASRASTTRVRITSDSWRRYYSLRNLILILREYGAGSTALRVALTRGLFKPLANLVSNPTLAWNSLRIGVRASIDGFLGRLGRRVQPDI